MRLSEAGSNGSSRPGGDFEARLEANREGQALSDLLGVLHERFEIARLLDTAAEDMVIGLGKVAMKVVPKRFTWPDTDKTIAPSQFNDMYWTVDRSKPTGQTVSHVVARVPLLTSQEFDELPEEEELVPNDVLIEIFGHDGQSQRYLVNEYGITPYLDGETIDTSLEEYFEPRTSISGEPAPPNVFRVKDEVPEDIDWLVEPMTATELQAIFGDCFMSQHSNPRGQFLTAP